MPITPEQFLRDVDHLVALPDVCFRVNEMVDDPNSSALDIAHVLSRDPNLTAQLLRIANSPYYGFPSRVETISRAISVIGMQDLRDLVLSTSVINAFSADKNDLINMDKYWRHSLFTGFIARELGSKTTTKVLCKERLFAAGLLHDIGQLVMLAKIPEIMRVVLHRAKADAEPYHEVEQVVFGLGHSEIGAALMKKWHLPESFQAVALYHHEPEKAEAFKLEVSIVHIANAMSHIAHMHGLGFKEKLKISHEAWELTGLDKKTVVHATKKATAELEDTVKAFVPSGRAANA
ncbi:MAG: HDOD domain-containing protein [Gammaproteobacteria bacterium]|nr:HDOD domain-containing protein [Gammaproteobacteria bacterium]